MPRRPEAALSRWLSEPETAARGEKARVRSESRREPPRAGGGKK